MLRDINNIISFICSCVKGSNSYKALLIRVSTKLTFSVLSSLSDSHNDLFDDTATTCIIKAKQKRLRFQFKEMQSQASTAVLSIEEKFKDDDDYGNVYS